MKAIEMWRVWSRWNGGNPPSWSAERPIVIDDDAGDVYWQRYIAEVPDGWFVDEVAGLCDRKTMHRVEFAIDDNLGSHELRKVTCLTKGLNYTTIKVKLVDGAED